MKYLIVMGMVVAGIAIAMPVFAVKSVAEHEQTFLSAWDNEYKTYKPKSTSGDEWQLYSLGYAIDANHAMFIATGDTKYLDRALEYIEDAIGTARPSSQLSRRQFKDQYLSWENRSHGEKGNDGREYPLFETFGWRYVTSVLRAMYDNTDVMNDASYRARYQAILDFTEKNIWEKWYTRGVNSHMYRNRTHMASHWARIAMNLYVITEDQTKKAQYKEIWDNIDHKGMPNFSGASLRGQVVPFPGDSNSYFWSYFWNQTSRPGQDVAHGNAVVSYFSESNGLGFNWTDTDMQKFVNTMDKHIFVGSRHSNYVDGSGTNSGWYNDGFYTLGRYSASLQEKFENRSGGARNTQMWGNLALNSYILNGGDLRRDNANGGSSSSSGGSTSSGSTSSSGGGAVTACHTIVSGASALQGFGVPWNPYSSSRELLLKVDCGAQAEFVAGNGSATTYIYEIGYAWRNNTWQQFTFTGAQKAGTWIVGQGSAILPHSPSEFSSPNYVVGYTCLYINNSWRCGCKDAACTTPAWQIQAFQK